MDYVVKDRTFDSLKNINGSTDYPIIELGTSIADIQGACLVSANVPFTYYVFNTTNNQFKMGTTAQTLVTIPPQTCNAVTLPSILANALSAAGVANASNYVFYMDNTTSQLVVYNTQPVSFQMDFTVANNCATTLGFASAVYTAALQSSIGTVYANDGTTLNSTYYIVVSPYCVNLSGPSQMFLHCDYIGPAMAGAITNDSNASNIIGDFRVNTNYQGTITYENIAPEVYLAPIASLKRVKLYLTTGSSTVPLVLNGSPFQVKMRFFCRSKQNNVIGADDRGNRNVNTIDSGGSTQLRPAMAHGLKRQRVMP